MPENTSQLGTCEMHKGLHPLKRPVNFDTFGCIGWVADSTIELLKRMFEAGIGFGD